MTDSTTPAITPEKIEEWRALLAKATWRTNTRPACPKSSDDMCLVSAAVNALPALLDLAQSVLSAQAETGWRSIPEAVADGERAIVAVRKGGDGEWIVGEAYYRADETASASSEVGWWWAGEDPGDYCAEAIHVHHGEPEFYMPLPPPPAKGGE